MGPDETPADAADTPSSNDAGPQLSIVVPVLNEQDNLEPLVEQVRQATVDAGIDTEMIVVDDGSSDQTLDRLMTLSQHCSWLTVLHRDHPMGQSASLHAGIRAARGRFIATLDGDLQNDPADLPTMLNNMLTGDADMVQGDRTANRRDTMKRRFSSWVGRMARRLILSDATQDTGCSTRMMRAAFARQLPLQFHGMHRFIPIYGHLIGARIIEVSVNHRPRILGVTKYGMRNRGVAGLIDCFAVRWMRNRHCDTTVIEISRQSS